MNSQVITLIMHSIILSVIMKKQGQGYNNYCCVFLVQVELYHLITYQGKKTHSPERSHTALRGADPPK